MCVFLQKENLNSPQAQEEKQIPDIKSYNQSNLITSYEFSFKLEPTKKLKFHRNLMLDSSSDFENRLSSPTSSNNLFNSTSFSPTYSSSKFNESTKNITKNSLINSSSNLSNLLTTHNSNTNLNSLSKTIDSSKMQNKFNKEKHLKSSSSTNFNFLEKEIFESFTEKLITESKIKNSEKKNYQ